MRYTPERIASLESNEIFVFGSNLQGVHRSGAAKDAIERFGAIYGKGVGRQGQTYAIPTMNSLELVGLYLDDLLEYAADHPELTFYVTKLGTGIAGHALEDVAALFRDRPIPGNVFLPREFAR